MDAMTPLVSPLRQRMIEDMRMRMRKLEAKTKQAYIRAVLKLSAYLKRSPDTATAEDLRNFQLHLVDIGTSPITLNAMPSRWRGCWPQRRISSTRPYYATGLRASA